MGVDADWVEEMAMEHARERMMTPDELEAYLASLPTWEGIPYEGVHPDDLDPEARAVLDEMLAALRQRRDEST